LVVYTIDGLSVCFLLTFKHNGTRKFKKALLCAYRSLGQEENLICWRV